MVAEGAAKIKNVALDYFRLDESVRPHSLKQFVLGDQMAGVLDQKLEHRKCLGRQSNPLVVTIIPVAPKAFVNGIQLERRKLLHARTARPLSSRKRFSHDTETWMKRLNCCQSRQDLEVLYTEDGLQRMFLPRRQIDGEAQNVARLDT